MQPEIPAIPQEENQSEPSSASDVAQPESFSNAVNVQPENTPKVEKKRSKIGLAAVALVVGLLLVFALFGWVGYWAYQLSTDLTATQQQLSTLQTEHEKLKTDYAALTSENEKLNSDLTTAQSDLATAQAEVKKLKDENQKLNTKLKKASTLAEILNGFFHLEEFSSFVELDGQIKSANDSQLTGLWDEFAASPSEDSFGEFLIYLIPSIQDALK